MLTGNKGEWSELYVLFKLLADRRLYAGDENLNKIERLIFPIIEVIRKESEVTINFSYEGDVVIINGNNEYRINVTEFKKQADLLLYKIKNNIDRTFFVEEIESFIRLFEINSLKANSTEKSDIKIVIHDALTGTEPELGFSIKSQLGEPATLLNASKSTNFIYRIDNLKDNDKLIDEINAISGKNKIKDRIKRITELGGKFHFERTEKTVFENNLVIIDSLLPRILSEILLSFFTSKYNKVFELVYNIHQVNPLGYCLDNQHPFYSYKIKRFLTDIALGMMPAKVWTGKLDATGGYLVVKNNGDIVSYHIYNRNDFENYLFLNTKLETASSSRHGFGSVYQSNGQLYFNLNLQIRFLV